VRFGAGEARHKPGSLPQFVCASSLPICVGGAVHLLRFRTVPWTVRPNTPLNWSLVRGAHVGSVTCLQEPLTFPNIIP
jgi:hypothetical protein